MSRDGDERKNTNVFVKRGANEQDEIIILNKNDIMKSIPKYTRLFTQNFTAF